MKSVLKAAGQHGAAIVIAGVVIGLVFPFFAELARPYLAIAIFIFTFGSFLKIDAVTFKSELTSIKRNALIVLWATFGIPLVVILIMAVTRPGPDLAQGLLFWALVPASPACVAFASILRLNPPIALMATVVGTVAAPFYIPALAASLGGYQVNIDPVSTCEHLILLIGGAGLAAVATKRLAGGFVRSNPEAMTGIAVLAMFLAGMGSMRGMQAHLITQPLTSLEFVVMAYALLFGAELLGTALFWSYGRSAALSAGLVSGTRTITLAWVVLGDHILPLADLFLAASMVAKYTAPGLTKSLLAWIMAKTPVGSLVADPLIRPRQDISPRDTAAPGD
jgi:BASS family bile acid:Na+ symporter